MFSYSACVWILPWDHSPENKNGRNACPHTLLFSVKNNKSGPSEVQCGYCILLNYFFHLIKCFVIILSISKETALDKSSMEQKNIYLFYAIRTMNMSLQKCSL